MPTRVGDRTVASPGRRRSDGPGPPPRWRCHGPRPRPPAPTPRVGGQDRGDRRDPGPRRRCGCRRGPPPADRRLAARGCPTAWDRPRHGRARRPRRRNGPPGTAPDRFLGRHRPRRAGGSGHRHGPGAPRPPRRGCHCEVGPYPVRSAAGLRLRRGAPTGRCPRTRAVGTRRHRRHGPGRIAPSPRRVRQPRSDRTAMGVLPRSSPRSDHRLGARSGGVDGQRGPWRRAYKATSRREPSEHAERAGQRPDAKRKREEAPPKRGPF